MGPMSTIGKTVPPRGEALRMRIAAQADAAFAAGSGDPLRLLLHDPTCREDKLDQYAVAERLLLERPPPEPDIQEQVAEEPPVDLAALRHAAENGDLKALAQMDRRLKGLLDSDDQLKVLEGKDLTDEDAQAALRLYRTTFMALERRGANIDKEAFQAVMRDDAVTLRDLLGQGLDPNVKNAGGHTLLQLAQERGKIECAQELVNHGAEPF
eukprot:TRINITY_DN13657_c0_g2_i2.p1 TRINITY_DN13657_c0_g2~~TRINITY_DN13657_c0_g2_i2.p1  ORF type:complete len:211 (+),score=62.44 TRINITY_DN13657_c0_g2_i2:82-714(+)